MLKWQEWMRQKDPFILIGLAGVRSQEGSSVSKWGLFFIGGKMLVAIALLWQWQVAMFQPLSASNSWILNCVIWCFFIIEWVAVGSCVSDHRRYIRENWVLPLIVLLGIPFIIEDVHGMTLLVNFRPFLAILLLMPSIRLLIRFFVDGHLCTTLLAAGVIVMVFGLLVAGVDPNIQTAWDGIWWAVATVSAVGYGDIVPSSPLGRLIGIALIVLGLGIFVVITANFLALILKRERQQKKKEEDEVEKIVKTVYAVASDQKEVIVTLNELHQRLERLEESLRK